MLWVALAGAAWALFGFAVLVAVEGWVGLLLALGVLLYSLAFQVLSWQVWALTDGSSLSLFTAWMATLVFARRDRAGAAAVSSTAASAIVASLARPQLLVAMLPLQAVVVWRQRRAVRPAPRLLAVAGLSIALVWGGYRLWQATSLPEGRARYAINNLVGKPGFREFAAANLSSCPGVLKASASFEAMALVRERLPGDCPAAYSWLASPASSWFAWAAANPTGAARGFVQALRYSILPLYSTQRGPLPGVLERLLLLQGGSVARATAAYLVVGVVLAAMMRRRARPTTPGLAVVAVTGVAAVAYCFLTWGADGMEIPRHMMPVLAVLPPVALVAPALLCGRLPGARPGPAAER